MNLPLVVAVDRARIFRKRAKSSDGSPSSEGSQSVGAVRLPDCTLRLIRSAADLDMIGGADFPGQRIWTVPDGIKFCDDREE